MAKSLYGTSMLSKDKWDFSKVAVHSKVEMRFIKKSVIPQEFPSSSIKPSYKKAVLKLLEQGYKKMKESENVTMRWAIITPALAVLLLPYRRANRRIVPRAMRTYASELELGSWMLTGQCIIIDDTGRLLDGQNRIGAVIETGIPMEVLVVQGIPHKNFEFIDNGIARSAKHVMESWRDKKGNPLDFTGMLTDAINTSIRYAQAIKRKGVTLGREKTKPRHPKAVFNDHPQFAELCRWYQCPEYKNVFKKVLGLTPGIAISAMYFTSASDKGKASEFWDGLASGANLGSASPVLALRNWLGEKASEERKNKFLEQCLEAVIVSWNLFVTNARSKGRLKLSRKASEPYPSFVGAKRAASTILKTLGE
jgi:hypothetical protein